MADVELSSQPSPAPAASMPRDRLAQLLGPVCPPADVPEPGLLALGQHERVMKAVAPARR